MGLGARQESRIHFGDKDPVCVSGDSGSKGERNLRVGTARRGARACSQHRLVGEWLLLFFFFLPFSSLDLHPEVAGLETGFWNSANDGRNRFYFCQRCHGLGVVQETPEVRVHMAPVSDTLWLPWPGYHSVLLLEEP